MFLIIVLYTHLTCYTRVYLIYYFLYIYIYIYISQKKIHLKDAYNSHIHAKSKLRHCLQDK